jgi:hypothetical protein
MHLSIVTGGELASLTKIVDGKPPFFDALPNAPVVRCPRCHQPFRLGYSGSEWNEVKDWLRLAETAMRKDHGLRHEAATIPLEWCGIGRR